MTEEKPNLLFTPKYKDLIKLARELNTDSRISGDIYFHPRESGNKVIVKTIDLTRSNPLCEVNNSPGDKQDWEERWVEAYLIHEAKEDDWEICLAGGKYRFLASQFTFRKHPEWKGTKHVDLLLYDKKKRSLIVLELKADTESFHTARLELTIYIDELKRLFIENEDEKNGALKAFDLEAVEDVIGYIVYPCNARIENESPVKEKDFSDYEPFGLIEYTKPWEKNFDEVKKSGRDMKIDFTICKPVARRLR